MPEVFIDDRNFDLYKQCEIRRWSARGYFFDIVWIKADLVRKNAILDDAKGLRWWIEEVYGSKKLPGGRGTFKQVTEHMAK